ncbi:MAG: peroxiredoxin [Candidatus Thermofonsia Clade 1 bacterium]|jgi:peroxiredoxin Q/BCP|uniref:thioredoxin-dependent peroxiredoxin n=1 Tax=Candidatus Thermofonsia Clade 1 bacterium TaxID=2364210 RepID=A0A2M8PYS3_9CHLR|nr:MAG: peroxiredoxin [Candidatus Thermofonsia Clade 1 bacterium]PJF42682.1 MAG: peroxiredoxin [Candidatus Thermofonsia Clade 1 bacterium]
MSEAQPTVGAQIGNRAPDFTLRDQNKQPVHLADLLGKGPLVLFFYPKAHSPVCTQEACAFRDAYTAFSQLGVTVIGISDDPPEVQRSFAQRYRLPYILLSDERGKVHKLYEARTAFGLLNNRVTFILDRDGIIRHRFADMLNGAKHVQEALEILKRLTSAP